MSIHETRAALDADRLASERMTMILDEIELERRRQIEAEGFTTAHDDEHALGEIALAAAAYSVAGVDDEQALTLWPWDLAWWKPKDRRANLVRSAALNIAEIERLDRLEGRSNG